MNQKQPMNSPSFLAVQLTPIVYLHSGHQKC